MTQNMWVSILDTETPWSHTPLIQEGTMVHSFLSSGLVLLTTVFVFAVQPGCVVDFSDHSGGGSADAQPAGDASTDGLVGDGDLADGAVDALATCGNGIVNDGEECDGQELGGRTCLTETGLAEGELTCTSSCQVDTSGCHQCGNGIIEAGEECDGEELGGKTCQSEVGVSDGLLACTATCQVDTSGCHGCGNGVLEAGEECDGQDFGDKTCMSEAGLPDGDLTCTSSCQVDTSMCHMCGNGVVEAGEECDGQAFGAKTCQSEVGLPDGTLLCDGACRVESSLCHDCGNGIIEVEEACDDGNRADGDGCSSTCTVEPFFSCSQQPSVCDCTVYVNKDPPPQSQQTGASWQNAASDVRAAVAIADSTASPTNKVCMVWVAQGRYLISSTISISNQGVALYGGFVGNETSLDQRETDPMVTVFDTGGMGTYPIFDVADTRFASTMDGLTVAGGIGSNMPGAVNLWGSSSLPFSVSNCRFEANRGELGGAIFVDGRLLVLSWTVFLDNRTVDGDGGAILVDHGGSVWATHVVFSDNEAPRDDGGAIAIWGGTQLRLEDTVFENNEARMGGGLAVSSVSGTVELHDVTWNANRTDGRGAAVLWEDDTTEITCLRCVFSNNRWHLPGAMREPGLVAADAVGSFHLVDSLVVDNEPELSSTSSPLFRVGTVLHLTNVTMAENKSERLIDGDASLYIQNSIVAGNEWLHASEADDCSYSDIYDSEVSCPTGDFFVTSPPLFASQSGGDYHLSASSPCIDAANGDWASSTDLEGNSRYDVPNVADQGSGSPTYVDMGAYEYQP